MSDPQPQSSAARTVAEVRRGRWPGLVWAVPLAALLVVGFLGLRALADQGVDVVVTFKSAAGARPGDTKVVYDGLEVGRVTKVGLSRDAHGVDMTLRLDPKLRRVLTTGTKFWLIGASPSLTDLNSLKAAVAGLSIGLAPGGGEPTRHLVGLDEEPVVVPGSRGREVLLDSDALGEIRRGSVVLYRGSDAGRITKVTAVGPRSFRLTAFILSPFDRYVHPGSLFWNASSVSISLTGQGLSGQFAPNTVLGGGVAFDTPDDRLNEPESAPDTRFPVYGDEGRARQGPDGAGVLYQTSFNGSAGELAIGAAVSLDGARVGVVKSVGLVFDAHTGLVSNPITFALFPQRLHIVGLDPAAAGQDAGGRRQSDAAMQRLVQLGYRLRIEQSPPLIGGRNLAFSKVAGAIPASVRFTSAFPYIPSLNGSDSSALTDKADELLTKFNSIPIEAIGRDVRQITERLSTLVGSPKITDSLSHLDSTLASVDQMAAQVKPQVGPLIAKLNQTADQLDGVAASANGVLSGEGATQDSSLPGAIRQLSQAARSVRDLADYLGRHPEAVIKGKVKEAR